MGEQGTAKSDHVAPSPLPRTSLALVAALHVLPFGIGAFALPFRASWLTLVLGLLALLNAVVAGLALARRPRELRIAWQVLAAASLLVLAFVSFVALASGLYLIGLYRSVGGAVTFGLFAFWAITALFTLPIACWGLACTLNLPKKRARVVQGASGALLLSGALGVFGVARSAAAEPVQAGVGERFEQLVSASALVADPGATKRAPSGSLFHASPASCKQAIESTLTLLVTELDREGKAVSRCLQAESVEALVTKLERALASERQSSAPALLDLVTTTHRIGRLHPALDGLVIRPALDGVCNEKRCLAPWQLVALGVFTHFRPIPRLPEAAFGSSLEELARALGEASAEVPLYRIETRSYALDRGKLTPWVRLRPKRAALDRDAVTRAVRLAERHILSAQQENGAFRYTLDPFTGQADVAKVSLPRQAGTTLVLCQLGRERRGDRVVARALEQLASYEKKLGDRSALTDLEGSAKLGSTALPLIAFASCRAQAGDRYDELIARLSRWLLSMQRPDGGFYPEFDLGGRQPRGQHEAMYSAGQGVLALVLVEQLLPLAPGAGLPGAEKLASAIDRAMDFYATSYWPAALRDLFYLEENWHCLAAEAALASHRRDDYERFCLDYVAFKSRLILREADGADPEHVGGYSVTNALPPHSATTAGFGETLAAAISVMRARGLDVRNEQALLEDVMGFLVRQQWTEETCLACAPGVLVAGAFSESSASPVIRIDYVQHAMAALGHGGRVLGRY